MTLGLSGGLRTTFQVLGFDVGNVKDRVNARRIIEGRYPFKVLVQDINARRCSPLNHISALLLFDELIIPIERIRFAPFAPERTARGNNLIKSIGPDNDGNPETPAKRY